MKRKPRQSVPHYSYRQKDKREEKLVVRRMTIVIFATGIIAIIVWFWGTSFINLLGFLAKPIETTQELPTINLPISKPVLEELPEATNLEKIDVKGRTSSNQEITLEISTETIKTTSGSDGLFSFNGIVLKKGLNLIKVYVYDSLGEKLEETVVITLDKTPPTIEVFQPKEGQTFSSGTKSIKILGKTEDDAGVFINNLQAIVDPQGQFTFNYPVKSGAQKLDIKATDIAGNTKKVLITVVVSGGNSP